MISLGRIDDRIIHGQVVIRWLARYPSDGVLIVDDGLAEKPELAQIYKNAAPSHMSVFVFNEKTALKKLPEAIKSAKKYALIFKYITTLSSLLKEGCPLYPSLKEVFQGPSAQREGTVNVGHGGQFFSQAQLQAFDIVTNYQIQVIFQRVPEDKEWLWKDLRSQWLSYLT